MNRILAAIAAACLLLPVEAGAFDLNQTIDQTNFIVDGKCSGTLISVEHRLIITNHHCIQKQVRTVKRKVTDEDGEVKEVEVERLGRVEVTQRDYSAHDQVGEVSYVTEIIARKKDSDLALLQLVGDNLRSTMASPILPGDRPVQRGDRVWAVGNPLGLDATVTSGIVSNTTRKLKVPWANGEEIPFIQYDAATAPGNSGGALYDASGQLVGIPAAGVTGVLALAIPAFVIREFLSEHCYAQVFDEEAETPEVCMAKEEETEDG